MKGGCDIQELRDAEGSRIAGFSCAIGMTDALQAELWAIHDGLIFAWSFATASNSFSLVRAIVTLLQRARVVDILWIPRARNGPVDWLAKKAFGSSCQPLILDFPSPELLSLLSADKSGASMEYDHRKDTGNRRTGILLVDSGPGPGVAPTHKHVVKVSHLSVSASTVSYEESSVLFSTPPDIKSVHGLVGNMIEKMRKV
ncbi:hypothetical protein V6N12_064460 [Hibiscus sabdariffa]|uniref:RNase H type-1 domain-containing protein n=1 Tax=Hibiscus sabdariffa TaxID=183260 RepID=A0ABR2G6W8_9ROSI